MGCEAKVIVILCTVCSTLAVAISLSVIPAFYMEINQIYTEVLEGVQVSTLTNKNITVLIDFAQLKFFPVKKCFWGLLFLGLFNSELGVIF